MIAVREYLDPSGQSPYKAWFNALDVVAATKVATALERLAQGNKSSIQSVGQGVSEYRIDFGPGYRIYFGREGDRLVVLLGGGSKKRQSEDIKDAKTAWQDYKRRRQLARKQTAAGTPSAAKRQRT